MMTYGSLILSRNLMRMIRHLSFLFIKVIILTLTVTNARGQTPFGSVYSIFGVGEIQPQSSIQSSGMGFASIAINSPYWANTVNPAANTNLGGIYTHIFDFGVYYAQINYDKQSTSETLSGGGISHLSYWYRFSNKWTGIIGISPYSKVGYNITSNKIAVEEGNIYSVNYKGTGGLNKIYFGQGYEVIKNLTLGVTVNYIMGNLRHEEHVTGLSNGTTFEVVNQTSLHKLDLDFSANYKINIKDSQLSIGAIYNDKRELSGTTTQKLTEPDVEAFYDESEKASTYILPEKYGAGISFLNKKLMISGEIEFNRWSEAIIENSESNLNDTWRFAGGIELTPDREGPYLSRVNYRIGYFTENSYLTIEDTKFGNKGITLGLGIPFKSNGAMNIAYLWQSNGTTSNNLILETTHKITLAFSIRNVWFVKSKYQ